MFPGVALLLERGFRGRDNYYSHDLNPVKKPPICLAAFLLAAHKIFDWMRVTPDHGWGSFAFYKENFRAMQRLTARKFLDIYHYCPNSAQLHGDDASRKAVEIG